MTKLRKLYQKVAVHFYYTAKPKSINPISIKRRKRESIAEGKIKSINNGELYNLLQETIEKSKSTGCEYSDYLTIWEALNQHQPKNILECGSGISSVVFAYYISKSKNPEEITFISMDSVDFWHDQIVEIFPKELHQYVQFKLSDRMESLYNGVLGCHYKEVPPIDYDFIFVDGPLLRKVWNDKSYPKCFNADIINILMRNPNVTLNGLLDQRIGTLWNLRKLIPKGSITYNPVKKVAYFNNLKQDQLLSKIEVVETDN